MTIMPLLLEGIFFMGCALHSYTDFKEMLLYDEVSLVMLLAGLCYNYLLADISWAIVGAVLVGAVFLALYFLCPEGVGQGDVKLAFVLGAWLGWQKGLLSLVLSLWLGLIVGGLLLMLKRKQGKEAIPFGPYICLSGLIMLYYGEEVLQCYSSLF